MDAPPAYEAAITTEEGVTGEGVSVTVEYGAQVEGAAPIAPALTQAPQPQYANTVASDPKFCRECGQKWLPGSKFCSECGMKKIDMAHMNDNQPGTMQVSPYAQAGAMKPSPYAMAGGMQPSPYAMNGNLQVNPRLPVPSGIGHIIENTLFINFDPQKAIPGNIRNQIPQELSNKGINQREWQDWMDEYTWLVENQPWTSQCSICIILTCFFLFFPFMISVFFIAICGFVKYLECISLCLPSIYGEFMKRSKQFPIDINERLRPLGMMFGTVSMDRIDPSHVNASQQQGSVAVYFVFTLTEEETVKWESKPRNGMHFLSAY